MEPARCRAIFFCKDHPNKWELNNHIMLMELHDFARLVTETELERGIVNDKQQYQRNTLDLWVHRVASGYHMSQLELERHAQVQEVYLKIRLRDMGMSMIKDGQGKRCIQDADKNIYRRTVTRTTCNGEDWDKARPDTYRRGKDGVDVLDVDQGSVEDIRADMAQGPRLSLASMAHGQSIFQHIEAVQRYELTRWRNPTDRGILERVEVEIEQMLLPHTTQSKAVKELSFWGRTGDVKYFITTYLGVVQEKKTIEAILEVAGADMAPPPYKP